MSRRPLRLRAAIIVLSSGLLSGLMHAQTSADISWLSVFRLEVQLPYGLMDTSPGGLPMAIENERIPRAVTEQLPLGFLRAHLRLQSASGTPDPRPAANFTLKSWVAETTPARQAELSLQDGANRFESPWVAILADPRASIRWTPAIADKAAIGCSPCERPPHVAGKTEAEGVYEVWAHGRWLIIRPEPAVGSYDYLREKGRMQKRISSVMADTVRIADQVLPSKTTPLFGTQSVNDVLVHSGELAREAVDLAIRGRGLNFVLRRFYSSAVYSFGPLGRNVDSPLFARTQWLSDGRLVFYDGTGRLQQFKNDLTPYPEVFLRASSTENGVVITYPDHTIYAFDQLGRLSKITDRNATKADRSDGNTMDFSYNAEGRLALVADPTGRVVRFSYYSPTAPATSGAYPGLLSTVTDFTGRTVRYGYDQYGRLVTVTGPDPTSARSAQQVTTYIWGPEPTSGNFRLDVLRSGQITSEKDGKGRMLYSIGYNGNTAWRADSVTTSLGTWNYAYSPGTTTVTDPLGRSVAYGLDGEGRVTSVVEPGGATTRYVFDAEGRLQSTIRPTGTQTPLMGATTYNYASGGDSGDKRMMLNIAQIVETPRPGSEEALANQNRTTTITYGERNLPAKIVDPGGGTTVIRRDPRGNPLSVKDALGVTTTFEFDARGLLRKMDDPRKGLTTFGYYTNDRFRNGYLESATTSGGTTKYGVDTRGNLIKVTQPNGSATAYVINSLDQTEEESTATRKTERTYDAAGMLASQSVLAGSAPNGSPLFHVTTFETDEGGRVRTRTDDGRATTYGYDAVGNLTTVAAPATALTTYGYDPRNRLTSVRQGAHAIGMTLDDDGAIRTFTNARSHTTFYAVSGFGETAGVTDPSGVMEATTLDGRGRPIEQRTLKQLPGGETVLLRWTQFVYDPLGRVTRETRKRFAAPLLVPATGDPSGATDIVTETLYDDVNRTMTMIDPVGNRVVTTYDALGRPSRIADASGNTVETTYDANGNRFEEKTTETAPDGNIVTTAIRYGYDHDNRVISVRNMADPNRESAYRYDARGNLIESRNAMGRSTTFEYDLRSNKVKETDPEGGITEYRHDDAGRQTLLRDPNGNETTFAYDNRGNLLTERRADGAVWTHSYDENGNRQTTTDPNGTLVTNTYNARDELVQRDVVRGAEVAGPSRISWTRDDLGRPVTAETSEGVRTTTLYDSLDQVLAEALQFDGGPLRSSTHDHDLGGNETSRTYPSGLVVSATYTPLNMLAAVLAPGSPPLVRYGYTGNRLSTRALSNGIGATWTYDRSRRLEAITHRTGASSLAAVRYERNPGGEKTAANWEDPAKRTAYVHNRNGWIVEESKIRTDTEINSLLRRTIYDIDATLNFRRVERTVQTNAATTSSNSTTVNARNQYTTFGGDAVEHDRNGNVRQIHGTAIQYDFSNRLTRATLGNGTVIEVTRDADGRKVRERETGIAGTRTTEYVLAGDQVLEEYVDGNLAMRYVRGMAIDEIVRTERSSAHDGHLDQTFFPLQDELGNVERLTGPAGESLERYEYEGYGQFRVFIGETELSGSAYGWRWLFQGREYQPRLNAYDFRARTLWPELGRFGQEDPLGTVDSPNLYQAFLGNFADHTDPLGSIIDETPVLSTNRRKRYENWRRQLRDSSLGLHLWTLLDSSPVVVTMTTVELTPTPDDDGLGAVTTRSYDIGDRYVAAQIAFSDAFARNGPTPATDYPQGVTIFAKHGASRPFNVYSLAHELGHALWPLRPWSQPPALLYQQLKLQIDALNARLSPLARGTPLYQQLYSQKVALLRQVEPLRLRSEHYADSVGHQVYLSWRAAHPGLFRRPRPHLGVLP